MTSAFGQLIYPDEYNRLRNLSTIPPNLYSNIASSMIKSNSTNSIQPPMISLQSMIPDEFQNAANPAQMENTLQGWSDHVSRKIF